MLPHAILAILDILVQKRKTCFHPVFPYLYIDVGKAYGNLGHFISYVYMMLQRSGFCPSIASSDIVSKYIQMTGAK